VGCQRATGVSEGILAKRFGRRTALRALGAAAVGGLAPIPWPAPEAMPGRGSPGGVSSVWRPLTTGPIPRALTASEMTTLEPLVERIIPETETPGAAAAGVHWYLDLVAEVEPETKRRLQGVIERVEARAQAAFRRPFAEANEEEQTLVLLSLSGEGGLPRGAPEALAAPATKEERAFFDFIKGRVVDAYYRSEVGQVGELEWVGHEFYDRFPGACTHADPVVHPRRTRPATGPAGKGR